MQPPKLLFFLLFVFFVGISTSHAQLLENKPQKFTQADTLRGSNTSYRNWWDVVKYQIKIEPNFQQKSIEGTTEIFFKVHENAKSKLLQLDLQQPLTVDDIEYTPEQFAAIDANEVENISILKDASTTAIYGIKGANGVLVVTTRRGKLGTPQITYRNELSVMKPTVMPEFLDSYETALLYNKARVNDKLPVRFTDDDLQKFKDGSDPYGHPNNNWRDILFKDNSKQVKGNFDVSGGTEKVKYFVSAGFLFQDGLLKNYGKDQGVNSNFYYTRYNYRSNLDIKATKTLDVRIDLYGNLGVTNTNNIGSAFGYNDIFYDYVSFLSLAPFNYPVTNPDGTFGYSKWQRDENPNYNQNNIVGRITHYGYNRRYGNNMNLVANANQKLDFITEGLSVKGVLSYASTYPVALIFKILLAQGLVEILMHVL